MALSQMEKTEIMHRVMGLRDDELKHMLKFIPTAVLLAEISRREGVIIDKLSCVCQVWDNLTINKPFAFGVKLVVEFAVMIIGHTEFPQLFRT